MSARKKKKRHHFQKKVVSLALFQAIMSNSILWCHLKGQWVWRLLRLRWLKQRMRLGVRGGLESQKNSGRKLMTVNLRNQAQKVRPKVVKLKRRRVSKRYKERIAWTKGSRPPINGTTWYLMVSWKTCVRQRALWEVSLRNHACRDSSTWVTLASLTVFSSVLATLRTW